MLKSNFSFINPTSPSAKKERSSTATSMLFPTTTMALALLFLITLSSLPTTSNAVFQPPSRRFYSPRCNNSRVFRLKLVASSNTLSSSSTIQSLPMISAQLLDSDGERVRYAGEWINVSYVTPSGLNLFGVKAMRTNSQGQADFTNLKIQSSKAQAYNIFFTTCQNKTLATYFRFVVNAGAVSQITWVQTPLDFVSTTGDLPFTYSARLLDTVGNIVPDWSTTISALVNDISGNNAGLVVTGNSGTAVAGEYKFTNLRILAAPRRVLTLQARAIVSGVTYLTPTIRLRVVQCSSEYRILGSTTIAASLASRNFTINGWFDYGLQNYIWCRVAKSITKGLWMDMCNVQCPVSLSTAQNTNLEISYDRVNFFTIAPIHIAGDPFTVKITQPKPKTLETGKATNITAEFYIVDVKDNRLLNTYPNVIGPNRHLYKSYIDCTPVSPVSMSKFFSSPGQLRRNLFVDSVARVNITLAYPDPGFYTLRCNTTLWTYSSNAGWGARRLTNLRINATITEGCPEDPSITRVEGCRRWRNTDVYNCNTNGTSRITVTGVNFGRKGARATLSSLGTTCTTVHDLIEPTTRLYVNCSGTGQNNTITVILEAGMIASAPGRGVFLHFSPKPEILGARGCSLTYDPSTFNCFLNGTNQVQIRGRNFGSAGAIVRFYFTQSLGASPYIQCGTVTHLNALGTLINCTNFPGEGQILKVAVLNMFGEETISNAVVISYIQKIVVPCPLVGGVYCNGHGDCNTDNGQCTCHNQTGKGFWQGTACTACQKGRFGSMCDNACPGGVDLPCGGPTRGTCWDGVTGNGTCNCQSGLGGLQCDKTCPGGVSAPCSNRGVCVQGIATPVCSCYQTSTQGYWSGTSCTDCLSGYVGASCTQACPTNGGVICNGQGTCSSGSSSALCSCSSTSYCGSSCSLTGISCGICPSGFYGSTCTSQCPAYPNTCSGHGTCGEGKSGTGLCLCNSGYATSDCSVTCPGGASNPCSLRGACSVTTGTCTCNPGYAGSSCSITCPGQAAGNTCSGRGTCSDGATGTGTCTCRNGYWGTNCENDCPGGAQTPCNLHGSCSGTTGACTCFSDSLNGYWQGTACADCQTDWWGPRCNGTCQITNGKQCAGHGRCSHELKCTCLANSVQGFWAFPNCSTCITGYWGSDCRKQCPGGACAPCSNHGVCSDGVVGAGTCNCFLDGVRGYWSNDRCSDCANGYWGITCTGVCPKTLGLVCSGHGQCSQGFRGTGACTCVQSTGNGFWGGSACEGCLTGYYGATCTKKCPGSNGLSCSGHGTCNDGFLGNGTCKCTTNYYGYDCSRTCPSVNNLLCSANGVCVNDDSTNTTSCKCVRTSTDGYWDGSSCSQCAAGVYGKSCILLCPRGGRNNTQVCSSHGRCSEGTRGYGNCTCSYGYFGKKCADQCQGGAKNPCSGHGVCSKVDGECKCFASSNTGYWTGRNCSKCDGMWNSPRCNIKCPTSDPAGLKACSGHGQCFGGLCFQCNAGYCGTTCEKSGFDCTSSCPSGYYGAVCQFLCPGKGSCSGRGFCSEGKEGTGKCTCKTGSWGDDCSNVCPGGVSNPCSGHGVCSTTGTCTCDTGYATDTCARACNGGASNPCNGRGTCDGSTGNCDCKTGYAGSACEKVCPGGASNPCNGHGTCSKVTGQCSCFAESAKGFWNGTRCDTCRKGYQGENCDLQCRFGTTRGKVCICRIGWSGAACDSPCPGMDSNGKGRMCNGHGNCTFGNTLKAGFCTCKKDYYTKDCSVYCTDNSCKGAPMFLANPQCDQTTGQCVCAESATKGYFTDTNTRCTVCKLFYWGLKCDKECSCRKRGGCDQLSGACQCFNSDSQGHFTGQTCEKCVDEYIGANCKGKNVAITRNTAARSIVKVKDRESSFLLADPEYGLLYGGGRPVIVFNSTTRATITTFELSGTVSAGSITGNNIQLTLSNLDDYPSPLANRVVMIRRQLKSKKVEIAETGKIFFVRASSSKGDSARRRLLAVHVYTRITAVATLEASWGESYTVMSSSAVSRIKGVNQIEDNIFTQYFTQVSCATLTSSVLIDPVRLLVGGSRNGRWQLIGIGMPSLSSTVEEVSSLITIPECANNNCLNVGQVVTDGTYVAFAMQTATGVSIARIRYTQLGQVGARVEYAVILDFVDASTVVNITAMLLDPLSGAGFVAVNAENEPTTLFKFDLITLSVYGSVRFQRVGSAREIVTSLYRDDTTRTLYASVPMELQHTVVPLNMYAVTKVFPPLADTAGGTRITIEGEGFVNENPMCDFNGTIVPADFISSRELQCNSPAGGDERCEGNPLEVSIGKDRYSKNNVPLRRVTSPRISRVYTSDFMNTETLGYDAYGELKGGRTIVIEGFGFQNSSLIACRIKSRDLNDAQIVRYANMEYVYYDGKQGEYYGMARFVSSSRMECTQPQFLNPTRIPAYIEVSLDGTVFSRSNTMFEVVGEAVSIRSFQQTSQKEYVAAVIPNLQSSSTTIIPPLFIGVTDSEGHRLRKLDLGKNNAQIVRPIQMGLFKYRPISYFLSQDDKKNNITSSEATTYCDYARPAIPTPVMMWSTEVNTFYTKDGLVGIEGAFFSGPPSGLYTLRFLEVNTGWYHDLNFTIETGAAKELRICTEPGEWIDNYSPTLNPQPKLYMVDASGNQLPTAIIATFNVQVEYKYETTTTLLTDGKSDGKAIYGVEKKVQYEYVNKTKSASAQDNFFNFEGIEMRGLHGHTYNISFYVQGFPNISRIYSRPMRVKPCQNNTDFLSRSDGANVVMYFAKIGTSECFVCPNNGYCDGTDKVQIRYDNWWRASDQSYAFYSCASPISGDSCLAPNGTCKTGYTGAFCSVCTPGYGKSGSYCVECIESKLLSTLFFLALFVGLAFCSVLIWLSLNVERKDLVAVVFKLFISHLQVAARIADLGNPLPGPLKTVFELQKKMSEIARLDFATLDCSPTKLNYYNKFFLLVSIPICIMVIFAFFFALVKLYQLGRKKGTNSRPSTAEGKPPGSPEQRREEGAANFDVDATEAVKNMNTTSVMNYYAACVVVIMFLVYPTVLQESMYLMQCDDVVIGDGTDYSVVSYFTQDRTIRCTEPSHQFIRIMGLLIILAYGIGTPLIAIIAVTYHWKKYRWRSTRRLFAFFMAGYSKPNWWWEVVVLARKVAIVSCIVFISDKALQVYVAMWCMTIALSLHVYFHPFNSREFPMLHYLEGMSLSLICVTLNMSLLYQFDVFQEDASDAAGYWVLTIALVALNVFMVLVFFYYLCLVCYRRIRQRFQRTHEYLATTDDGDDEADDDVVIGFGSALMAAQQRTKKEQQALADEEDDDEDGAPAQAQAEAEDQAAKDMAQLEAKIAAMKQEIEDLKKELNDVTAQKAAVAEERYAIETLQVANCVAEIAREEALTEALEEQLAQVQATRPSSK